jgi:protocatechuate 3,4-dioxygenase beta subunit
MLDCLLTPDLTEGPFFIDEKLMRSVLVSGEEKNVSSGCPLELTLGLFRVEGSACMPLTGTQIDIWHADVDSIYSDVDSGFFQQAATTGKQFLRGYQLTNKEGVVSFKTVYPGWYGSRAIHIHFKVRMPVSSGGSAYEFTSQMFFDETVNDAVMAMRSYSTRGQRNVLNKTDQVFNGTGPGAGPDTMGPPAGQTAPGSQVMAKLEPVKNGAAYRATLKIGVRMT